MKKAILSAFITLAGTTALFAQPILNGTDINPVPTEIYYGHPADTTGAVVGAPGGPVTWNFTSVVVSGLDTTTYLSCPSTPYCDSFAGSNLASFDNTNYAYLIANSGRLSAIGSYDGSYAHIAGNDDLLVYPFTYNLTHLDTFDLNLTFFGISFYHHEVDSMIYDAYGTITTPGGTYPNAVREHRFALSTDSSVLSGSSTGMVETYYWFVSGFHNPLFIYTADTANGYSTEYYTQSISLGVTANITPAINLQVYPNPAVNVVNLKFYLADNTSAYATLSDLTGRIVGSIGSDKIYSGDNEISFPVANLADGMYVVQLHSATGTISRKVVVAN